MTSVNKSALLPYTAREMYDLVDDIGAYAEFLPWCGGSEELARSEDEVSARIDIAWHGVNKSFSTLNRMQVGKIIEMRLLDGPFKHLEGYWRFEALREDASKVSLDLEFEFSNRLLGMTVGPVFSQITGTLVDAFSKRAVAVYGKR